MFNSILGLTFNTIIDNTLMYFRTNYCHDSCKDIVPIIEEIPEIYQVPFDFYKPAFFLVSFLFTCVFYTALDLKYSNIKQVVSTGTFTDQINNKGNDSFTQTENNNIFEDLEAANVLSDLKQIILESNTESSVSSISNNSEFSMEEIPLN